MTEKKILSALVEGQSYFAFDALGQTKGFAAWYEDGAGTKALGSRTRLEDRSRLIVRLPKKPTVAFETAILRDGLSVMTSNSTETEFRILQPGVYRVVVRLFINPSLFDGGRWVPWILTNPIVVGARGSAAFTTPHPHGQATLHAKRKHHLVSRADN